MIDKKNFKVGDIIKYKYLSEANRIEYYLVKDLKYLININHMVSFSYALEAVLCNFEKVC